METPELIPLQPAVVIIKSPHPDPARDGEMVNVFEQATEFPKNSDAVGMLSDKVQAAIREVREIFKLDPISEGSKPEG